MDDVVSPPIEIGGRTVGGGARCFVIAEAGVNHNGSSELAIALVEAAARAGADAVKFQTFDPAALASAAAPKAEYQKSTSGGTSQREMLETLTLPAATYAKLRARAEALGLVFLSSPFDEASADFLDALGVPAFKVASGELTNHPFLRRLARFRKPLLVSTGMSTLTEVRAALEAIRSAGNPPVALFHCVSSYPARATDANLRAMSTLRDAFGVPVGWSDHMVGPLVSVAAVALGAEVLEKHLTLSRRMEGPDHASSTEPDEFALLVKNLRAVEISLGTGVKAPVAAELGVAAVARRSLHWGVSLAPGEVVQAEHLRCLRPGTGLSPEFAPHFVGRVLAHAVREGALVAHEDVQGEIRP